MRKGEKDLELPLGKRTKLYRFFEILPGFLSYSAVILLFVLSWVNPVLGAIYVLVVVATTLVKAIGTAFRTIQGYKAVKRAKRVDWAQRLADLEDPHAAFERLYGRRDESYDFQEHV